MPRWSRLTLCIAVFALALSVTSSSARSEDERAAEVIQFPSESLPGKPLELVGHLRRPTGPGPFPAVILLHGCAGDWRGIDSRWGVRLVEWGYVALSVDSFGPRGIKTVCGYPTSDSPDHVFDAYGALSFLAAQPFVVADRVAVMGVSLGGTMTLRDVEQGFVEAAAHREFRAAVALYPDCAVINGPMSVPTLILIGELDDYYSPKSCPGLAAGYPGTSRNRPDENIRLTVLPGAYHAFDNTTFLTGQRFLGHWLEYNGEATKRSVREIDGFLRDNLSGRPWLFPGVDFQHLVCLGVNPIRMD